MIAVDSGVWIDYPADRPAPHVRLSDACLDRKASDIALVSAGDARRVESMLVDLDVLHLRWVTDFRVAAGLCRAVRASGVAIRGTTGRLIAAVPIREGVPLPRNDPGFDRLAEISELTAFRVG